MFGTGKHNNLKCSVKAGYALDKLLHPDVWSTGNQLLLNSNGTQFAPLLSCFGCTWKVSIGAQEDNETHCGYNKEKMF